jgi:hypothetical protein
MGMGAFRGYDEIGEMEGAEGGGEMLVHGWRIVSLCRHEKHEIKGGRAASRRYASRWGIMLGLEDISQTHHRSFSAHTPASTHTPVPFLTHPIEPDSLRSLPSISNTVLSFSRHVVSRAAPTLWSCEAVENSQADSTSTAVSSVTSTTLLRRTGSTFLTHSSMVRAPPPNARSTESSGRVGPMGDR